MHLTVGKLGEAAVVEARDNIGIPAAGFYQAAVVMVEARQGKHFLHTVFRHRGAYAFHQFGIGHFVAVDIENPIVAGESGGEVLHRAESDKFVFADAGVFEPSGDFQRAVGRAVVQQQDFVETVEGGQDFG